jgi:hypothetical protein
MADTYFHGEFSSADASALNEANSRVLLYGPSSTTAITVGATDVVVVTGISVRVGATGMVATVYDGADNAPAAGEILHKGTYPASGAPHVESLINSHFCQVGTWPKVKGSVAGQIDVVLRGYVRTTS